MKKIVFASAFCLASIIGYAQHKPKKQKIKPTIEVQQQRIKPKWDINISFGPHLVYYGSANMRLRNKDMDIIIENLEITQRTSFNNYRELFDKPLGLLQWIDEPQNRLTIEANNNKYFFFAEYTHPKILYQDGTLNKNKSVKVEGVINGKYLKQRIDLSDYIYGIQTTTRNVNIEIGGGKVFTLFETKNKQSLEIQVGAGAGINVGASWLRYKDENDVMQSLPRATTINGFNAGSRLNIRYNFLKDRIRATLGHSYNITKINGRMGDARMDVVLNSNLFSFQIGMKVNDWNNKSLRENTYKKYYKAHNKYIKIIGKKR